MNTDRNSWTIKDEAACAELLQIMNITPAECGLLSALQSVAQGAAPGMLSEFHGRLMAHPHTAQYFEGVDLASVQQRVGAWFVELFSGVYDDAYARRRISIGHTHVRIGLPVRYPIAMLDVVLAHGEKICATAANPVAATAAFKKILSLDVAVFNQAYEDNQLKHLSELVGGERLARRLLAGQG